MKTVYLPRITVVIPADAGIQPIHVSAGLNHSTSYNKSGYKPMRASFFEGLDSRIRGNDWLVWAFHTASEAELTATPDVSSNGLN